ncbi:Gfo/Idh/MocA family protein [Bacillus ndiopicus]|uniref:Gfo/Idh/MocA family protein n=1 Tax=Bacillus ndiopicus TaxID=1347368 RepID=UPI0005A9F123|nr:Gfo/Idh/MocA family oxidoreductase [Bacillus ndiopicus]
MNFAIVGCGFIAKKHAEAIKNIKGAKLYAVCDKEPELMQPYVVEHEAEPYTDFEEMLQNPNIDIVNICTPSGSHAILAELAAKYKKHIIVEKPIAMTIEDTDRIIKAATENNIKLAVVHPNRFRPVALKLKEIMDSGKLGEISHALCVVNWNRGQHYYDQSPWRGTKAFDGGVLMNQAIHNLDLLLWYLGNPMEVMSMDATRLRKIEVEDVSTGIIRFESGAIATVQASTTVYPRNYEESITIFGEKGTVKIGGTNALYFKDIIIEGMSEVEALEIKESIEKNPWGTPGHQIILSDMMESIRQDRPPIVTGEDGKTALSVVLNFYKSSKEKRLLTL